MLFDMLLQIIFNTTIVCLSCSHKKHSYINFEIKQNIFVQVKLNLLTAFRLHVRTLTHTHIRIHTYIPYFHYRKCFIFPWCVPNICLYRDKTRTWFINIAYAARIRKRILEKRMHKILKRKISYLKFSKEKLVYDVFMKIIREKAKRERNLFLYFVCEGKYVWQ